MFVRFDCGCIGIEQKLQGKNLILKTCNDSELCFFLRTMSDHILQNSSLSEQECLDLINEIQDVFRAGYRAQEFKTALNNLLK